MIPEPRPAKNCDGCKDYEFCPCACHVVGNYMVGLHHHFNYVPDDNFSKEVEKVKANWGN